MASHKRSTSRDHAISEAYAAMNRVVDSHTIAKVLDQLNKAGYIHYADQCPLARLSEAHAGVIRDLLSQWESEPNGAV